MTEELYIERRNESCQAHNGVMIVLDGGVLAKTKAVFARATRIDE